MVDDEKRFVTYVLDSFNVSEEAQSQNVGIEQLSKTNVQKNLNGTGKMKVKWGIFFSEYLLSIRSHGRSESKEKEDSVNNLQTREIIYTLKTENLNQTKNLYLL